MHSFKKAIEKTIKKIMKKKITLSMRFYQNILFHTHIVVSHVTKQTKYTHTKNANKTKEATK